MTAPTDDELLAIASRTAGAHWFDHAHVLRFARAAIAAHAGNIAAVPASLTDEQIDRLIQWQWATNYQQPLYPAARAFARAVLAAAPQAVPVPAWQPIETAPKDRDVLVACSHGLYVARYCEHDIEWWHVDDNKHGPFPLRGSSPTHWQPLPAAPKEQPHE